MYNGWDHTIFASETQAIDKLRILSSSQEWMYRGQSKHFDGLYPSIDRGNNKSLSRNGKLVQELQSINTFRRYAQYFADCGEKPSMKDTLVALMVLQHYNVPTRLLDWSHSPWVSTFFAISEFNGNDGEIWTFNRLAYEELGAEQWKKFPENTKDKSGNRYLFDPTLTAFTLREPNNWFVCQFYPDGFPRQNHQFGAYSMAPRFGSDHSTLIKDLLKDSSLFHVYVIKADLKAKLLRMLKDEHNICRGSLFPDSAGAAETTRKEVFPNL